jgi:hypothetical protein
MDLAYARNPHKSAISAASARFKRFAPETEASIRNQTVTEDPKLARIQAVWLETLRSRYSQIAYRIDDILNKPEHKMHALVCKMRDLGASAKEIESFSLSIANFQKESELERKAGIFLSYLVTFSPDREGFVIHTGHLDAVPSGLCLANMKIITIKGPAGNSCGWDQQSGSITVEGDAGDELGVAMKGGIIHVKGNCGDGIGSGMTGGKIIIDGSYGRISQSSRKNYMPNGDGIIIWV